MDHERGVPGTVQKGGAGDGAPRVPIGDDLAAAVTAENEALIELLGEPSDPWTTDLESVRRIRSEGGAGFPSPRRSPRAVDVDVDGRCVRRVDVDDPVGAMLYVHGGGWNTGAADQQDELLVATADAIGIAVVAVDHRLAPEHPYPAPVDDIVAAVEWFESWAPTEFGVDRLVLAGDSTGAHLAACAAVRAIRRGTAWAALDLTVGIFDLGLSPSARSWGDRNLLLSTPVLEWCIELFTPGLSVEQRRDPAVSPLFAELGDLPPTLLSAAELDPLLDDSLLLHDALAAAGVDSTLDVYPAATHAFFLPGKALFDLYTERRTAFLRAHLGSTS